MAKAYFQFKGVESINGSFVQIIGRVIANKMTESSNYATISLDDAVVLVQDEDDILGTDSESEISEDDNDPSFANHDLDWVNNSYYLPLLSYLAVANFIPIFLDLFNKICLLLLESSSESENESSEESENDAPAAFHSEKMGKQEFIGVKIPHHGHKQDPSIF